MIQSGPLLFLASVSIFQFSIIWFHHSHHTRFVFASLQINHRWNNIVLEDLSLSHDMIFRTSPFQRILGHICGHWKLTIDPTMHCNIMVWLLYIELVNNFVKNTSLACCPSIFINFWKNKIHCFRINCFQLQIIHVKKIEYYLLKNGVTLTNHILHFILYYIFHGLSSFRLVLYATFVF